jgi:hypothetical protein
MWVLTRRTKLTKKSFAASKSDLDVLRKFAKWSNSFQVFDDERYEFGFLPDNSLNHLMVVEGWFTGKAPPTGHYSTEALKKQGKYVVEENPFFDEPFIIDPNLEGGELTKFSIPTEFWRATKSVAPIARNIKGPPGSALNLPNDSLDNTSYYIIPLSEDAETYINHEGQKGTFRTLLQSATGESFSFEGPPWKLDETNQTFTHFPKATVNVGKPFMVRNSFINVMPIADYKVTVLGNHMLIFESTEHGFYIYLRGWMDEDHEKMKPYRSQEDDWLVGGAERLVKQFEKVHAKTELIKIK